MRVRTEWRGAMLAAFAAALACGGTEDPGDDASGDLAAANATSRKGGAHLTVGGTLSGLSGGAVTLQDNGSYDTLTLSADGPFTFAKPLKNRATYAVTVLTQPSGQTCTVANGIGTIAGANVTDVAVSCQPTPSPVTYYTVGGSIAGLSGTVVLQNNGTDDLSLSAGGWFTFATPLADGSTYDVTVRTQPDGQTCTVAYGTGTIAGANVWNPAVSCSPPDYYYYYYSGYCVVEPTTSTLTGECMDLDTCAIGASQNCSGVVNPPIVNAYCGPALDYTRCVF